MVGDLGVSVLGTGASLAVTEVHRTSTRTGSRGAPTGARAEHLGDASRRRRRWSAPHADRTRGAAGRVRAVRPRRLAGPHSVRAAPRPPTRCCDRQCLLMTRAPRAPRRPARRGPPSDRHAVPPAPPEPDQAPASSSAHTCCLHLALRRRGRPARGRRDHCRRRTGWLTTDHTHITTPFAVAAGLAAATVLLLQESCADPRARARPDQGPADRADVPCPSWLTRRTPHPATSACWTRRPRQNCRRPRGPSPPR